MGTAIKSNKGNKNRSRPYTGLPYGISQEENTYQVINSLRNNILLLLLLPPCLMVYYIVLMLCFYWLSSVPAWRLIMEVYSITVGFSRILYC